MVSKGPAACCACALTARSLASSIPALALTSRRSDITFPWVWFLSHLHHDYVVEEDSACHKKTDFQMPPSQIFWRAPHKSLLLSSSPADLDARGSPRLTTWVRLLQITSYNPPGLAQPHVPSRRTNSCLGLCDAEAHLSSPCISTTNLLSFLLTYLYSLGHVSLMTRTDASSER